MPGHAAADPLAAIPGDRAVAALLRRVRSLAGSRPPRILIDGRSGSGKTTLALALAAAWPEAQIVHLDHVYPGWDGLRAGADHVVRQVLRGDPPRYRRWDWAVEAPGEWVVLDPGRPLVVEGAGALSAAARAAADLGVWVDGGPEPVRRRRAVELRGDGESYAVQWDRWARQEEAFLAAEQPDRRADIVVTTAG